MQGLNGADLAVLVVPFLDGSSNLVEAGTDFEGYCAGWSFYVLNVEATVQVGRFMCWVWRLLCRLVVLCLGCGGYCVGWSFYVLNVEATVLVGRFMC